VQGGSPLLFYLYCPDFFDRVKEKKDNFMETQDTQTQAREGWADALKAIGRRLREQGLVSPEQVELLDTLATEFGRLAGHELTVALPLMSVLSQFIERERLARQQAQAAGRVILVRSAVRLTEEEETLLRERLRERFGEEFVLRMQVDPSLIGGLVVEARGQIIDGSIASKLDALKEHLQAALEEHELRLSESQISGEKE